MEKSIPGGRTPGNQPKCLIRCVEDICDFWPHVWAKNRRKLHFWAKMCDPLCGRNHIFENTCEARCGRNLRNWATSHKIQISKPTPTKIDQNVWSIVWQIFEKMGAEENPDFRQKSTRHLGWLLGVLWWRTSTYDFLWSIDHEQPWSGLGPDPNQEKTHTHHAGHGWTVGHMVSLDNTINLNTNITTSWHHQWPSEFRVYKTGMRPQ